MEEINALAEQWRDNPKYKAWTDKAGPEPVEIPRPTGFSHVEQPSESVSIAGLEFNPPLSPQIVERYQFKHVHHSKEATP